MKFTVLDQTGEGLVSEIQAEISQCSRDEFLQLQRQISRRSFVEASAKGIGLVVAMGALGTSCKKKEESTVTNVPPRDPFAPPAVPPADPTLPDVKYLSANFKEALESFYKTMDKILADNPVNIQRLMELGAKAKAQTISVEEGKEFNTLRAFAVKQGRAVGAVYAFFLKFKPYGMFDEIRAKQKAYQPFFGPVLVVEGDTVRNVLERNQEFSVDPYGREMVKVMTPQHNGGFDTFVLSTDITAAYEPDKKLLTSVVHKGDVSFLTTMIHEEAKRRLHAGVRQARSGGQSQIDVVKTLARYVPVAVGDKYLGVPVAPQEGKFQLTDAMLTYYGQPVAGPDGKTPLPGSALTREDGVIPSEDTMYLWIKSAFQNFFNNVQKDPTVQANGVRSCKLLLCYLLREIDIQRNTIRAGKEVADTMLTRLLKIQLGLTSVPDLDPKRVSDLRIAENVMGTIVGAVAGQEEGTSRVIDALMNLKEGKYKTEKIPGFDVGNFDEARKIALNILDGREVEKNRIRMYAYFQECLRQEPQGEILLRQCVQDGATIAGGRPISKDTLVFAAHGSAMRDVQNPDAFILGRDKKHYMFYGWDRHKCLGQYVSPVIITETMIALLGLEGLERASANPNEAQFPLERRTGRLQLDDNNLYATTFTLKYSDSGTTKKYFG